MALLPIVQRQLIAALGILVTICCAWCWGLPPRVTKQIVYCGGVITLGALVESVESVRADATAAEAAVAYERRSTGCAR